MKKIAVTGGIAAGKTTVCLLFEKLGAYVVNADAIVHELLDPKTQLGKDLIELLGADVVLDHKFSRRRIAQKVFHYPKLLDEFEKIIHPEVQKQIELHYKIALQHNAPLFVAEIPLLYEKMWESHFDAIVLVASDENKSKKRFCHGEEEFLLRSKHLLPLKLKLNKADYVIYNNDTIEDLSQTIQHIYKDLKEKT